MARCGRTILRSRRPLIASIRVEGQREYFRQCDPRAGRHPDRQINDFDHPEWILRDGTPQPLPAASVLSMDRPVRLRPLRMPDLPVVLEWQAIRSSLRANEWMADLPWNDPTVATTVDEQRDIRFVRLWRRTYFNTPSVTSTSPIDRDLGRVRNRDRQQRPRGQPAAAGA